MPADLDGLDGPADFDETFREHYGPMVRSLAAACGDREAAADAVPDAFTRASRAGDGLAGASPSAWIRHVTLNRPRDHFLGRNTAVRPHPAPGETPTHVAPPEPPDHDLPYASARLPGGSSIAVSLFYIEQLSVREIATSMKLSEGAVKYHLHAGRAALPRMAGARMTDDFDFDPLEQELRRRFDTLDAAPDDPDAVLDAMRPAPAAGRSARHRIATSAVATLVLVGAVVVGLAAFGAATPAASASLPRRAARRRCPRPRRRRPTRATPTVSTPAGPDDSGPTGTTPAGRTLPEPTGTGTPAGGTTLRRRRPAGPTTTPTTSDTPYASAGGSIVVHRSGSAISLGSSTPARRIHPRGARQRADAESRCGSTTGRPNGESASTS